MLSVSSFESEGLSLCRRPPPPAVCRSFVFIRALGLGQPGKFFKCMIGRILTQRFPPTPSSGTPWDRWPERSGAGSVQSFQEFTQHGRAPGRIGGRCTWNWLDSASFFEALVKLGTPTMWSTPFIKHRRPQQGLPSLACGRLSQLTIEILDAFDCDLWS